MTRAAILNAFNPDVYKGGIETFILNLKALLEEHNISVDIHFISPEPNITVKPFPIKSFNKIVPEFLLNCFMLGRAFSKIEKNYDLAISNNFYGLGYFSPKVKSFNIYHSTHAAYSDALKDKVSKNDHRDLKYLYGHLGDRLSGRGKIKAAVSQSVKDEMGKYYKFKDITVINHGVDTDFYIKLNETTTLRKKRHVPEDAFVGIFVGRWEIGKGIDIIQDIVNLQPSIIWILAIGNSDCSLNEQKNIRIVKNVDKGTLRELYSISDFMLFPSSYEGFGLAIIEALACKLPVICTEVGIVKDLLHFNALRKLILPNCGKTELIKEITDRISFLKREANEKDKIINTGRSIIERYYNIQIWKERMSAALSLSNE